MNGQIILCGSTDLSLFLQGDCSAWGTVGHTRSGFNLKKHQGVALFGYYVDFSTFTAIIASQYAVAVFAEKGSGNLFAVLTEMLSTIGHIPALP